LTHLFLRALRPLVVSKPCLTLSALLLGMLVPRAAAAVQSAELYRSQTAFYGRFEARVRFAPGEGVVSSFFLWKDRPTTSTPWNELDFEKINSDCRLQTNIWTGTGTQNKAINTPSFNICSDYHNYAFEWTPDYIAWFIDGTQVRKVTGASVTEYTQNASGGMAIHFNIWQGDSSFGGNLDTSILPVYEYISWVQYSSYANGVFQLQWREDFTTSTLSSGWAPPANWTAPLNHSTHNPANVKVVNGIAVLALTNDNATGYTGTPPVDSSSGGTTGTGGTSGGGGSGGGGTAGGGRGGTGGGAAGAGGRAGTGGGASGGRGGIGGAGTAGNGAAGVSGGTAGNGAGGMSAGSAGNGAAGAAAGTAGDTGGPAGSDGASGTGGVSTAGGGGTTATGGGPGTGGTSSGAGGDTTGSGAGCGCYAAGGDLGGGSAVIAVLFIAACAFSARTRRRASRRRAW
jgi:endo-1,3-1,4-beta-glycanase ExoK